MLGLAPCVTKHTQRNPQAIRRDLMGWIIKPTREGGQLILAPEEAGLPLKQRKVRRHYQVTADLRPCLVTMYSDSQTAIPERSVRLS